MTFLQFLAIYCICGTAYGIGALIFLEDVRVEFFGKGYKRTLDELFFGIFAWIVVSYFLWWYILPLDAADWLKERRKK